MMISKELIKKVAQISKLELTENEEIKFTEDFKEILNAFQILDELNVTNVKSSFRPFEQKNTARKDEIKKSISQKEALSFTKNKEQGFFIGPKTK